MWSDSMPTSANAASSTGVPCVIASVCRNWVVLVKMSTLCSSSAGTGSTAAAAVVTGASVNASAPTVSAAATDLALRGRRAVIVVPPGA